MSELLRITRHRSVDVLPLNRAKANLDRYIRDRKNVNLRRYRSSMVYLQTSWQREKSAYHRAYNSCAFSRGCALSLAFSSMHIPRSTETSLATCRLLRSSEANALLYSGLRESANAIGNRTRRACTAIWDSGLPCDGARTKLDQNHAAQLEGFPRHEQRHLGNVPLPIIRRTWIRAAQFDKAAATWMFQLLCKRYEQRSTIISSSKICRRVAGIFGNDVIAAAMFDRSLHHCTCSISKARATRMKSRNRGMLPAKGKQRRGWLHLNATKLSPPHRGADNIGSGALGEHAHRSSRDVNSGRMSLMSNHFQYAAL